MSRCLNFNFRSKYKAFFGAVEAPIDILPDEVIMVIFKYLSLEDLVKCEDVCRRWRKIATDPNLWRDMTIVCSGRSGVVPTAKLDLIKSHRKCVRCIKLQYILNYPIVKSIIDPCINLISIELVMCRLEKDFEDYIKKWKNLKTLNLKNSLLKSDTDLFIQYDHFKKLNFLGLSEYGLSTANCDTLLRCKNLNHINIEKIRGLNLEFIKLLIRTKQSTLASLVIYGGPAVDDEVLVLLAKCPMLRELGVLRCETLSDKALIAITRFSSLHRLQLWNNTTFSESELITTLMSPVLVKMRSLSLSKVNAVTTRTADVISDYYKNLRFLALYQCPMLVRYQYEEQMKQKFRNIKILVF